MIEMHVLSVDERFQFLNAMIMAEQAEWIKACNEGNWMVNEFRTYRLVSKECYGKLSDEGYHRILDQKKIPWKVPKDLWEAFLKVNDVNEKI